MVYEFFRKTHADFFQKLLEERHVEFERFLDTESEQQRILFGIEKRYLKESNKSNYLTHAEFRNPFIRNKFLGIVMVIITLAVIAFAIFGYLSTK